MQLESTFARALEREKRKCKKTWEAKWKALADGFGLIDAEIANLRKVTVDDAALDETIRKLLRQRNGDSSDALEASSLTSKSHKLLEALEESWTIIEFPSLERASFLENIAARLPKDKSVQTLFEKEAAKLADRRSVLQLVGTREKLVLARPSVASSTEQAKITEEIRHVDDSLRQLIPEYEANHLEQFMLQGSPYLRKLGRY